MAENPKASEHDPAKRFIVKTLDPKDPDLEKYKRQLTALNRKLWLNQFSHYSVAEGSNPSASQTGYTIPHEYSPMPIRLSRLLQPGTAGKMFLAVNQENNLVGYCETTLYQTENDIELRFPLNNFTAQASQALIQPHVEIREIAVDPEHVFDREISGRRSPSASLLQAVEQDSQAQGIRYVFAWIIGHGGPNIPNKKSWRFFTASDYQPVATTSDSDIEGTKAVAMLKQFNSKPS